MLLMNKHKTHVLTHVNILQEEMNKTFEKLYNFSNVDTRQIAKSQVLFQESVTELRNSLFKSGQNLESQHRKILE